MARDEVKRHWDRIAQQIQDRQSSGPSPETNFFGKEVSTILDKIRALLIAKNAAYGDSATNPIRIASKADAEEQLLVRIDDKLSRIARGAEAGEDVWMDLAGYVVLLLVVRGRK